jgi:outer membrane cobalamin receptor
MMGVEQIEVVRGGGSSAWGNYALGGVVQVLTRRPTERALFFDASYGTRETMNCDLLLQDVEGPGRSAAASAHSTTANCASRSTPAESA